VRDLARDAPRLRLVLCLLRWVPAGCEDIMHDYLLYDAEERLREEVALCDAPLYSLLLTAHPCACATDDLPFVIDENTLDVIQAGVARVFRAAYSVPDTFTVSSVYCLKRQYLYILVETAVPLNKVVMLSPAHWLHCVFTISETINYPTFEEDKEMRHAAVNPSERVENDDALFVEISSAECVCFTVPASHRAQILATTFQFCGQKVSGERCWNRCRPPRGASVVWCYHHLEQLELYLLYQDDDVDGGVAVPGWWSFPSQAM
jgi:hypothetical protein